MHCKNVSSRSIVASRVVSVPFGPVARRPTLVRASSSDDASFEEVASLLRLISSTDIVEMELKSRRFNLSIKKQEAFQQEAPVYMMPPQQAVSYAPSAPAAAPPPAAPPAPTPVPVPAKAPVLTGGVEISSPMSGTFYSAPAPGEPNFLKVGDRVKKGQTVGIIEAMKLMNEIEAEVSGEVIRVMVDNGKQVTPGQALFLLK